MTDKSKSIDVCLEIKRETAKAFLVSDDDGKNEQWIPKSQISTEHACGIGDTVIFSVPEWLCKAKGFI